MNRQNPGNQMRRWVAAAVCVLATAQAFAAVDESATSPAAIPPTFSGSVAQVVYTNCTPCHRPGGGAPMDFLTHDDVQKRARMIAKVTAERTMPPWKAEPGDVAFHGERHMADEHIALLAAWADAGAPLGDAAAVPPVPVFTSDWPHGEPDLILQMEEDMPVPADGPDIYRGFVVRIPNIPEGKYLKGLAYRPKAIGSAHHTLFSLDTAGDLRERSEATAKPGFGGMESNLSIGRIGGWAVGAVQPLYPDGVSIKIQDGTDLVLATHFHPSGKPEVERAEIGLYLTDEAPARYMTGLDLPFGFGILEGIKIPAGESNYTIKESFTLPVDVKLSMVSPHAHYIAKSMKAVATLPDGQVMNVITVNNWDFAWQEQYEVEEPVLLPAGTRMDVEFVYDNSADNPRNPNSPPKMITFGPESTDEMACITMAFITETQEANHALRRGYVDWVKRDLETADLSIVLASASEQRRDRFDLNGDGSIALSEVASVVGQIRKRFSRVDPDNMQREIMPMIWKRAMTTVLLPWLLPRAAIALAIFIALIAGLRYIVKRRKKFRATPQPA